MDLVCFLVECSCYFSGVGCEPDTGSASSNFIVPPSSLNNIELGTMTVGLEGCAGACGTDNIDSCLLLEGCASPNNRSMQRKSRLASPQKSTASDNPARVAQLTAGSLSPILAGRVPPGSLHQNILNSSQAERLTRISPTEVDHPYIECFLNERRSNNGGQCLRLSPAPREVAHSSPLHGDGCTARAVDDNPLLPSVFLRSVLNGANSSTTGNREAAQPADPEDQCAKRKECGRFCDAGRPTTKNTAATTPPSSDPLPRWADKACQDIQFIDDDFDEKSDLYERQCSSRSAVHCTAGSGLSAREIMQSTQMLNNLTNPPKTVCLEPELRPAADGSVDTSGVDGVDADQCQELDVCLDTEECANVNISCDVTRCDRQPTTNLAQRRSDFVSCSELHSMMIADVPSIRTFEPRKTRLVLTNSPETKPKSMSKLREMARNALCNNRSIDMLRGKRRGHCGIANPILPGGGGGCGDDNFVKSSDSSDPNSPVLPPKVRQQRCGSLDGRCYSTLEGTIDSLAPPSLSTQSTSLPASPVHRLGGSGKKQNKSKQLAGRSKLQSPLTRRRLKNNSNPIDSSDDEHAMSAEEVTTSENYRNLETFQKAQLNKKVQVQDEFDLISLFIHLCNNRRHVQFFWQIFALDYSRTSL